MHPPAEPAPPARDVVRGVRSLANGSSSPRLLAFAALAQVRELARSVALRPLPARDLGPLRCNNERCWLLPKHSPRQRCARMRRPGHCSYGWPCTASQPHGRDAANHSGCRYRLVPREPWKKQWTHVQRRRKLFPSSARRAHGAARRSNACRYWSAKATQTPLTVCLWRSHVFRRQ